MEHNDFTPADSTGAGRRLPDDRLRRRRYLALGKAREFGSRNRPDRPAWRAERGFAERSSAPETGLLRNPPTSVHFCQGAQ